MIRIGCGSVLILREKQCLIGEPRPLYIYLIAQMCMHLLLQTTWMSSSLSLDLRRRTLDGSNHGRKMSNQKRQGWEQPFDQDLMKIGIVSPFMVDRLQ